jgi:hypothetical protein
MKNWRSSAEEKAADCACRSSRRILPLRSPFATTVWDYINRAMPLNRDEVIPEDEILDAQRLPKVRMPIGDKA